MASLILSTPIPQPDVLATGVTFKDRYIAYLKKIRPDADPDRYWEWRTAVLAKSGGSCSLCGQTYRMSQKHYHDPIHLDAHHIKTWRAFPAFRYDPDNGQAVCRRCHNLLHERQRARWAVQRTRSVQPGQTAS